jgi:D-alanyl-lipoteichoic acid acyltransferase DltB (MBOAT superfamily)
VDAYKGLFKPVKRLRDFFFYVSFFPHLVAGPIVRPMDLIPQIYQRLRISKDDMGNAVFLLVSGLFKKAVISDYISSNFVDRIFENPTLYSGVENLLAVYAYTLQIYCDFSGYTDMAMGIALLIGFRLPNNFNSPYQSASLTEFWRRWHISLSTWLRDYLYIPLGGNRVSKFRQAINLMITMLLGGLWHGASWKFVFWGAIHGVWLVLEKIFKSFYKAPPGILRKVLGIIITFHIVSFCWIFFRASSFESAWQIVSQIIYNFNGTLLIPVLTTYNEVFLLIIAGYILHFSPGSMDLYVQERIIDSPLVFKSFLVAIIIWIVIQTKSAEVQPFIYFQF